jgi:hypothetical protein
VTREDEATAPARRPGRDDVARLLAERGDHLMRAAGNGRRRGSSVPSRFRRVPSGRVVNGYHVPLIEFTLSLPSGHMPPGPAK